MWVWKNGWFLDYYFDEKANQHKYFQMYISEDRFLEISSTYFYLGAAHSTRCRRFKGIYGVPSILVPKIWNDITNSLPLAKSPKHLLWTLHFLAKYCIEHVNVAIFNCDEKTYRKWTFLCVKAISRLHYVSKFRT